MPTLVKDTGYEYRYIETKQKYSWLKEHFFIYLSNKCLQKNVDIHLALAIIDTESDGRNIVSRKNRNGTRDYGYFQVNSVHMSDTPLKLLNYITNIDYGVSYLSQCLKKAKGQKILACVYYNGGMNCNVKRYLTRKTGNYPLKVYSTYIKNL